MAENNLITSILSVSSKNGNMRHCGEIIHLLKKIGIASTVIANRSVICNPKSPSTCYVEYGCDIRLNNLNPLFIKSK